MSKLTEFIQGVAPTVASAILGPLGGVAVAGLGKIFGVESASVEAVTQLFQDGKMTPEQLAEIKKMELEFKAREQELGFSYADLEYKNTDSARKMQMETHSTFPATLSGVISVGFFAVLFWMLFDPTVVNSPPLLIMLGALGSAFGAVINFWLGSTSGSKAKDQLLAQSVPVK